MRAFLLIIKLSQDSVEKPNLILFNYKTWHQS